MRKARVPSLDLLRKIAELRERGLGYRAIVKELGLGVSYKTVERWLKKYGRFINGVKVTRKAKTDCHVVSSFVSLEPEDKGNGSVDDIPVGRGEHGNGGFSHDFFRGLGRTERLVLEVMFRDPYAYWSPSLIRRSLGLLGFKLSRNAIWAALRRLVRRGLVVYSPMVTLFCGAVFRGAYRLQDPGSLFGFADRLYVHNVRVPGDYVVVDDRAQPLTLAFFRGVIRFGEVPVTQIEVNYDYPMPREVLEHLKGLGWSESRIYPKPELGVIRFEHRLFPKDLALSLDAVKEVELRYRLLTKIVYDIALTELTRLGAPGQPQPSSDRRGVVESVPSVL